MKITHFIAHLAHVPLIASIMLLVGCVQQDAPSGVDTEPHVAASSQIEAGRYLTIVAGCNDCHTGGYLFSEGQVPEDQWLLGWSMGFRGPWGTTYPPNLRLVVDEKTEDEWVTILHTRTALPPMPWMNLNKMSEDDARALYAYISSLGAAGDVMPNPVPPDQEPEGPYILMVPQSLPSE